ncbi:MAG: efflux RND transporter permease subunit [Oleispira antarctica]|nr:efflux RND transporter permease subunit [Oleispira antarctica]MBQ0791827.1 efflux RND transporter permease subunit [Oleispira antarctica]
MRYSIQWFINNPVAANLFMFSIFILGLISIPDTRMELIPNVSLERIGIQTALPGATVETVEATVCKPIEQRIYDIPGTLDLTSTAYEGLCSITLDVADGFITKNILDEVKNKIQSTDILPKDASLPDIKELNVRNRVAKLILSGDSNYPDLAKIMRKIRADLFEFDNISIIDLEDIKHSKIEISVPSHNLEKYDITFSQINNLIKQQSGQLPGGLLKTQEGNVLITSDEQIDSSEGFSNIVILANSNGAEITLSDIATIRDNRYSHENQASFDNKPAVSIDIYRIADQNIMDIAKSLNTYIANAQIPDNMQLHIWQDDSKHFKSRIDLLLDNAFTGLLLLFVVLLLFLNARLSFWVSLGIPISFFGSLFLMPFFDVSINIISLFAFILVLGIVVDDAVVIGESVHQQNQLGNYGRAGALEGTYQVYKPIFFAIATSIVAFLPLLFLPGPEGKLMQAIPIVVILTLIFSLLESIYILPAHLSGNKPDANNKPNILTKFQNAFSHSLDAFIDKVYQPLLIKSLHNKGLVIISFSLLFIIFMVVVSTGWMRVALFSAIEADVIIANVVFPEGSPRYKTEAAIKKLVIAANQLKAETMQTNSPSILHVYSVIGPKNKISNQDLDKNLDHNAQITLELSTSNDRPFSGQELIQRWRELTGTIADIEDLKFSASLNPAQPDINIEFSGHDLIQLTSAANQLKEILAEYDGSYDIRDSISTAKQQANINLKDNAIALDLSLEQVLSQVHRAYQGSDVQNIQTQDDEINVWLGLPESERSSMWYLENLPIKLANGQYISLSSIANIEYQPARNHIKRYEQQRVVSVSAYIDSQKNSISQIKKELQEFKLNTIIKNNPGIRWNTAGQQKSIASFIKILTKGYLIAILVMYLMMAILFSSYSQPLLVLFAIPFGLLGSLVGHLFLNLELTLWSFVGMVAVSGVVVNDNLVLMNYINQQREQGQAVFIAVCDAGKKRFRPILLTSLTTFVGLTPLILETSIQAQFLIPMAVSLAFGVLFATFISLLLVPASYLLLDQWLTSSSNSLDKLRRKKSTTDLVEQAYQQGFQQGSNSKQKKQSPYRDDVLDSSWEAGWQDAKNNKEGFLS